MLRFTLVVSNFSEHVNLITQIIVNFSKDIGSLIWCLNEVNRRIIVGSTIMSNKATALVHEPTLIYELESRLRNT